MKRKELEVLKRLLEKDKFSENEWKKRHVSPSSEIICSQMNILVNDCTENLILKLSSNPDDKALKLIVKKHLKKIKKNHFDTEEREFIMDVFYEISEIIKIDISKELNYWLYGRLLGFIINQWTKKQP